MDLGAVESPLRHLCDTRLCFLTCKTGIMTVFTSQQTCPSDRALSTGTTDREAKSRPSFTLRLPYEDCSV
ncbi:hypothetical protein CapIbe_008162 [Capra ibex]